MRRNRGRPGAAKAPAEIRRWLYRLSPWDVLRTCRPDPFAVTRSRRCPLRFRPGSESTGAGWRYCRGAGSAAIPIVLGGGHETAFGHYLGYAASRLPVGIINLDAHLDVRPILDGLGHSGSPFRQALEHSPARARRPLRLSRSAAAQSLAAIIWCMRCNRVRRFAGRPGAGYPQPASRSGTRTFNAAWLSGVREPGCRCGSRQRCSGSQRPNRYGSERRRIVACARLAGESPNVTSFDLVEINPAFDRDGQSARWAAVVIWYFLVGLANRPLCAEFRFQSVPPGCQQQFRAED